MKTLSVASSSSDFGPGICRQCASELLSMSAHCSCSGVQRCSTVNMGLVLCCAPCAPPCTSFYRSEVFNCFQCSSRHAQKKPFRAFRLFHALSAKHQNLNLVQRQAGFPSTKARAGLKTRTHRGHRGDKGPQRL